MNAWKWWIVIICVEDWYKIYEGFKIVRGRSAQEAIGRALAGHSDHYFDVVTFGPFVEKPQAYGE